MFDFYVEQLVKRRTPFYTYLLTGVLGLLTVGFAFLAMTISPVSILLMAAFAALTYFASRYTCIEFEYLFVENTFSVDAVYGRAKRKNRFECTMDDIQIIAPANSPVLKDCGKPDKTLDFTSRRSGARTHAAILNRGGTRVRLLFEPDERLLEAFRRAAPRKLERQ